LRFVGFPMDQIVMQVLSGEADVGIVRSGLIESLVGEGRIDPDALVFLNANRTYTHTDVVSTGLFPEWPFVALASTPQPLKDQVAVALLTAGQTTIARDVGMIDRWSSPVPYHGVVALTDAFRARITRLTAKQPAPWISIFAMLSGLVTAGAVFFWWRGSFSNANTSENSALASKTDAAGLTNREKQILDFVVLGRSTKEIAIALDISPKTVEFHRSNILKKYGAQTSIQLVMMAT